MNKTPKKSYNLFGIIMVIIGVMYFFSICSGSKSSKVKNNRSSLDNQLKEWKNLKIKNIKIVANDNAEPDMTRNFYFIIDGSGSMAERTGKNCGGNEAFIYKLEGAKWAVRKFLEDIPDDINIGLYVFDSRGRREIVSLGKNNRSGFISGIDSIVAGGGTPLEEAIKYGTDRLVEKYKLQLGYGEYRLVVVTDGIAKNIFEAAKYAAEYGISLYSIGLCVGKDHPLRKYSVLYKAADNFDDLSEGLTETLSELPDFNVKDFDDNGGVRQE